MNLGETIKTGDMAYIGDMWRVVENVKNKDDEMTELEQTAALLKEANERVIDLENLLEKQRIVFNYQIDMLKHETQNWQDLYIELVKETKNKKQ